MICLLLTLVFEFLRLLFLPSYGLNVLWLRVDTETVLTITAAIDTIVTFSFVHRSTCKECTLWKFSVYHLQVNIRYILLIHEMRR